MDGERPEDWPSYFNEHLIRLDEVEGFLRRDTPLPMREKDGAWVLMRRYVPARAARTFRREMAEWQRRVFAENGGAQLDADQMDERTEIVLRRCILYIESWSYGDVTPDMLGNVPQIHLEAILTVVDQQNSPRSDEEYFRAREARDGRDAVSESPPNGTVAAIAGGL